MTDPLSFQTSQALLKQYGLPCAKATCTKDPNEVRWQFAKMAKPAVLKASGPGISHKTEKGLVFTSITCREQLDDSIKAILENSGNPKGLSFVLQEQLRGAELIIGGKRDPSFGPVILFGTGGIYAELLDDVSIRPAPLSLKDAGEMVAQTHARKFATGFRGMRMDLREIKGLLVKASRMLAARKDVLEFDFNPVIATPDGAFIVDARVIPRGLVG